MDFNTIMQAISTVGFPIACCFVMGWYVKYQTDKNREQIDNITAQNKEQIEKVTEALNNNTLAVTKLCERMDK